MSGEPYKKWQCGTCGELYDEEFGSPETGIDPGTRFEDLPEDWICPLCGGRKEDFIPFEQ